MYGGPQVSRQKFHVNIALKNVDWRELLTSRLTFHFHRNIQTFAVGVIKLLPCQLNVSIDLKTMSIT